MLKAYPACWGTANFQVTADRLKTVKGSHLGLLPNYRCNRNATYILFLVKKSIIGDIVRFAIEKSFVNYLSKEFVE